MSDLRVCPTWGSSLLVIHPHRRSASRSSPPSPSLSSSSTSHPHQNASLRFHRRPGLPLPPLRHHHDLDPRQHHRHQTPLLHPAVPAHLEVRPAMEGGRVAALLHQLDGAAVRGHDAVQYAGHRAIMGESEIRCMCLVIVIAAHASALHFSLSK